MADLATMVRELSMQSVCGFAIGSVSLLGTTERPEKYRVAADCDLSLKAVSHAIDTFWEIAHSTSIVPTVLSMGSQTKISPPVFEPVAVSVIDQSSRIVPRNHAPDQAMSIITPVIHRDMDGRLVRCNFAGHLAGPSRVPAFANSVRAETTQRPCAPSQHASSGIVVQALAQICLGWQSGCGHWSLLQRDWWQGRRWPGRAGAVRSVYTSARETAIG